MKKWRQDPEPENPYGYHRPEYVIVVAQLPGHGGPMTLAEALQVGRTEADPDADAHRPPVPS
ncbi:MAG: hypothetical protein ACRDOU_05380 [Streptosporangiaceae bacterium]